MTSQSKIRNHPIIDARDDAYITANTAGSTTGVFIRDAQHDTLLDLYLSPFAVRELRDALTRALIGLASATIEAAGLADIGSGTVPVTVPGSTFPAMNS